MASNDLLQVKQGPDLGGGTRALAASPEPIATASAADGTTPEGRPSLTRPSTGSSSNHVVDNTKRPPPFSRKLTKSLFIRPADSRGEAPGWKQSLWAVLTYSWINVLLLCNPVAWALHYAHAGPAAATFAVSLLGIIPLAGLLTFGTEAIALYTGDALGGLINASLGNATEFIIAILLLVKCEIRVVQASLLGGLLSNLLLVLGMAFVVGGIRFSEQEFMSTAAQLNTSLLTLAVIALIIPTIFAFALEAAVGEEAEADVILEMSRGSSIILIVIYIGYMVFQLYSHTHYYNPEADGLSSRSSSPSRSRSRSPGRTHPNPSIPAPNHHAIMPPTRRGSQHSTSLPFGSAARIGGARPHLYAVPSQRIPRSGAGALEPRGRPSLPPVRSGSAPAPMHRMGIAEEPGQGMRHRDYAAEGKHHKVADMEKGQALQRKTSTTSSESEGPETPKLGLPVAIAILLGSTGLAYLTAEALTDSLEAIGDSGSVSKEWLGLILLAVVGNAAEHVTAVFVAYKNKVDLALAVAVGSCIQISLFVIPVLVLLGWIIGKPMSLLFDPLEVITLFLSVLLVRFATEDGRTHYMSGVALLGTYVLIAFSFWYYPDQDTRGQAIFTC